MTTTEQLQAQLDAQAIEIARLQGRVEATSTALLTISSHLGGGLVEFYGQLGLVAGAVEFNEARLAFLEAG